MDAAGVLDRALAGQVAINLAQAEQVALAAQFADRHGVLERPPAVYFPYSPNITGRGDNDHPNPYIPINQGGPPGQTGLHNQAWLGRRNHRIKTISRWKPR